MYEDVESECWLVFMKCTKKWTPQKGQLTTYFYGAVAKEAKRIVARAMGFGSDKQQARFMELKADCSRDLDGVCARFWPRTVATPHDLLQRAENIERGAALFQSVEPQKRFLVAQWVRGTKPRTLIKDLGVCATTMYNRRANIVSEMINAVPPHPDLAKRPPSVPPGEHHPST